MGHGEAESPLEAALDRVGDRWSLLVVDALLGGPRRWSELLEDVSGIAPNILSDRLKRLEREAVVASRPYSRRPLRVVYELTAAGRDLAGALRLLADWGSRRSPGAEPMGHLACGTPMEARWYCPTCARPVSEDEAQDVRVL
jgi:DNA-binding HxlR family transcriptional regulator